MHLVKALYFLLFFGSIVYFFLYGFVMKKLPVITIHFQEYVDVKPGLRHKIDKTMNEQLTGDIKGFALSATKTIPTAKRKRNRKGNDLSQDSDFEDMEAIAEDEFVAFLEHFKSNKVKPRYDVIAAPTTEPILPRETGFGVKLNTLTEKQDKFMENIKKSEPLRKCPKIPKRVGRIHIDKWRRFFMEQVQKELAFVAKGGQWKPKNCLARRKVAIVIPFRDRQSHLVMFLRHMHRFLKWQLLDYRIFVIEQTGDNPFNRGMLMNVGFEEAMKNDKYDCVIFHDVDLIPEDDRNDYSCPSSPRHMSTAVDTMHYKLGYKKLFGGVEAFWPEHYREVNGFPNRYWGWGAEDDDLYIRITEKSLTLTRPVHNIGRYTMMRHGHKKTDQNPDRHTQLHQSHNRLTRDGLNSLKYEVISFVEHPLHTMISVRITKEGDSWFD